MFTAPETQKVPDQVDFFAGLPYNRLISESVEDEAGIRTIMNEAEGRLSPGEDALRLIIDTTPTLIHTARPDGYIDYFNKGWLEFFGKALEDVRGWRWTDVVHPEDVAGIVRKWQDALETGEPFEWETRVRRADGEYRLMLHRKLPLRDETGAIVKWFGSSRDIQDEKAAQEQMRLVVDSTPALLQSARPDGYIDFVNKGWLDFVGLPMERMLGWEWTKAFHPDDIDELVEAWKRAIATGTPFQDEGRVRRADGEYRTLLHNKRPVKDKSGKVVKWYGSSIDIEDRKRAEERLRQSEFYLHEGQRLSHCGSWSFKPSGECDYCSLELLNILGFDPANGIPSIPDYLSLVHPDDRPSAEATIKRMIAEGIGCDVKKRVVRKDGATRVARCVGVPMFKDGKVARFIGTLMDITEQEQMTQELRRREAYLTQAEALSRTGSFGWNVSTGDLCWSDETFRILEYKRTVKPTLELLFKRIHPEDAATMQQTIERASKDAKNLDYEHRLLMPDGSIKHVHVLAQPFKDQSGNVEFVGALMDITDGKKAFQEIQALKDELYKENIVLREEVDKTSMFEEVVGTSPVLQAVLARAGKVAPTDSTVLITGETGTGKELIARAIHKRSQRSTRAFVSVNCAAIPQSLITSELFGHEKGAFTGATQRRLGRFELAEGGTLFLDEIGELPVETQIALLRVLQEREFERVGGTEPLRADVRVIAATNRDLQGAITGGTFRSDLFYRLNVFPIALPPLRERKEDIQPLVSYFVDRYTKRAGRKIRGIRKSALDSLESYSWPGNIRELQNVIERSLIVCETDEFTIDKSWLSGGPMPTRSADQASIETSAPGERDLIEAALAETKGKVSGSSGAAAKLGIPASTLESKIRSLKINKYRFKER
jgi:formate hydrogenlyase transcriptional activator